MAPRPHLPRPAALLLTALLGSAPLAAQELESNVAEASSVRVPDEQIAARSPWDVITWAELDELLVARHAMSEDGRSALKHLLRAMLLDELAEEAGLVVPDAEIEARERELEQQLKLAGESVSLEDYLRENQLTREVFRAFLRRGVVQEMLSRRALGVPEGRQVPPEQQEMWLDQILEQRGTELLAPPWEDGVAARCGDLVVPAADYVVHLRTRLPAEDVREACFQLLLLRRVDERMPDLSEEAKNKAVLRELERRRAAVTADPRYRGTTYDQLMAVKGVRLESLPTDPSLRVTALSEAWVERSFDDEGLRAAYAAERGDFDGRFGAAVHARMIFARAAVMTNALNPRSFEEATDLLADLRAQVAGEKDFRRLARENSEDPSSREDEGDVGWVTRADPRLPEGVRAALFDRAKEIFDPARAEAGQANDRLLGPMSIRTGCVLLWVVERRPPPSWEEMAARVRSELRRRFLEECLTPDAVVSFLDAE